MANFFVRLATGQLELNSPEQLLKLLATMARNKLLDQARRERAARRDHRRHEADPGALEGIAGVQATPSQIVANRGLLQQVRQLLTDEERFLADQRALGREWAEIGVALGARPDALRMKLTRAIDRVARQLGLEDEKQ
jgi:DNA-directed RNA polymerase specialized sigma24 family protein